MDNLTLPDGFPSSLIIPPRLLSFVRRFEAFYHTNKAYPLLIHGPRGAGKSLFVHILSELHRQQNGSDRLVSLDCQALGQNCLESEFRKAERIFDTQIGHIRRNRPNQAKTGGLLLLTNLETLSESDTTRLFSLLEERRRYHLAQPLTPSIHLIATQNSDEINTGVPFRAFRVPPIHERRQDILYFLYQEYPTVVRHLLPMHLLTLLAYHWPRNIPEIKEVGASLNTCLTSAISLCRYRHTSFDMTTLVDQCFMELQKTHPPLSIQRVSRLHDKLKNRGVDTKLLEHNLQQFSLGMLNKPEHPLIPRRLYYLFVGLWHPEPSPFQQPNGDTVASSVMDIYDVHHLSPNTTTNIYSVNVSGFREIYAGFRMFSSLFFQNPRSNKNILDVDTGSFFDYSEMLIQAIVGNEEELRETAFSLMESILTKYRGLTLPQPVPRQQSLDNFRVFVSSLKYANPSNRFLSSLLLDEDAGHSTEDDRARLKSDKHPADEVEAGLLEQQDSPSSIETESEPDHPIPLSQDVNAPPAEDGVVSEMGSPAEGETSNIPVETITPLSGQLGRQVVFRATPPFRLSTDPQRPGMVDLNRKRIRFETRHESILHKILTDLLSKDTKGFLGKSYVAEVWSNTRELPDDEIDRHVNNCCRFMERFFKRYGIHWQRIVRRKRGIGFEPGEGWHSTHPMMSER